MASENSDMQAYFNEVAVNYNRDNGGIPQLFAKHIASISTPITSKSIIHDNACGPAVVTTYLLSKNSTHPARLEATDVAPAMVGSSSAIATAHGWDFVKATEMDANKLAFADNTFTHSFTNMLIPTQPAAISEIYRTLQPDGTALYTAWKFHGIMDLWRRNAELIFSADEAKERSFSPVQSEASIKALFTNAGFDPEKFQIVVHTEQWAFDGIAGLVELSKTTTGRFFTRTWTDEDREKVPGVLPQALTDGETASQTLEMQAWVVTATK